MANETTSTEVTEIIRRESYAAGVLYFAERPGVAALVARQDIGATEPTLTKRFPIYDKVSAAAIAENTDFTTNSAIDTTGSVDVTVSEHAIKFTITRLALNATVEQMASPSPGVVQTATQQGAIVGAAASEALQRRMEADLTALFSGFNSSTGSNSGAITTTLFLDARYTLDVNNVPDTPRYAVLSPFQWKTLLPAWDDAAVMGPVGQTIVNTGMVGTVYGVGVMQTANVATATVSSSTVWAGAMFHPTAIALSVKGDMPTFETESDASLRAVEIVGTGVWGEAEYRGGATTSGRGGAGVYLYSNSTV